jgi:monoamine oxidase
MTRRDFLSASAGLAMLPVLGRRVAAAPLPREADIVVIGAGAAGIAAARRIMAANRKVIVVEASSQIGGRCQTDTTTFDVPFDRGARADHDNVSLARKRRGPCAPAEHRGYRQCRRRRQEIAAGHCHVMVSGSLKEREQLANSAVSHGMQQHSW